MLFLRLGVTGRVGPDTDLVGCWIGQNICQPRPDLLIKRVKNPKPEPDHFIKTGKLT